MNTLHHIKHILAVLAALLLINSCDSFVYDYEKDCTVYYRLKFRYDMNLKFADAFAHEVKSVRLFAFNQAGELVWQGTEQGDILASSDYLMTLPLAPGKYRLIAWCGLGGEESFSLTDAAPKCKPEDLHCIMNALLNATSGTSFDEISEVCSNNDLQPLFHGIMDVELPVNNDGGEYFYEMQLTKDTNVFRVVLQHLSGEDVNPDDFEFRIEDNNVWLAHDNSLFKEVPLVYHPWAVYTSEAGVEIERTITNVKAAVAEFTVNRLFMKDWKLSNKPMLVVRAKSEGKDLVRIPIIDYALLVKGEHHRQMDNQEYLDRADEYNMTFFLDENNRWVSTVINILSWRVVVNHSDLD